jgi:hypothetical protein
MFGFFRTARQLKHQNALLRTALLWYAAKENWKRRGTNPAGAKRRWKNSPAALDRGALANAALNAVDSGQTITVPKPLATKELDL